MRTRLLTLLLVPASVVLTLWIVEVALRLVNHVSLFTTDNFVARAIDNVRQPGLVVHDAELGWVLAPNLQQRYGPDRSLSFTTGVLGERMPDSHQRPAPQGGILAIGDSFTAGEEVADGDTWPAQIEPLLGAPVINAGVMGYGIDQIVLRAEQLVPKLRPHFLLVGLMAEDSIRNAMSVFGGAPKPYFKVENGALALHNVPVPRQASSTRDIGLVRAIFGRSYLAHVIMMRVDPTWWVANLQMHLAPGTNESMQISCLLMQRLAQLRDQYEMHVGVIVLYGAAEVLEKEPPAYGTQLIDCAQQAGLDVVDDFAVLRSVGERQGPEAFNSLWVLHEKRKMGLASMQVYGHMSGEGNRLLAAFIAESFFEKSSPAPAPK
jgi:hypothetical protein